MKSDIIVNFHEHPNRWADERCKELGIDMAVLLPVGEENEIRAIQMMSMNPERYIPFGWIDMNSPLLLQLEKIKKNVKDHGIKGLKFQPMDQHVFPDDKRLYPVFRLCEELGLIVTWHSGIVSLGVKYEIGVLMLSKYCNPIGFDQVAFDFPDLKICIAHLGGNYMYEALVMAEKHENIYLDTAFLSFFGPRFYPPATPSQLITHVVGILGADKILYGSEDVTPQDVLEADIKETDKAKILGGNAVKLLGTGR